MKKEEIGFLEVKKYKFQMIKNQETGKEEPKILIEMISIYDVNGKYVKHVSLEKIEKYLHLFEVRFKKLD